MVEFGYNNSQIIQAGQAAILNNIRPCQKRPQQVLHDDETPNIMLRGIVRNPCCAFAQYNVHYSGNISIPEGGTAGEIQLALSVDGYVRPLTIAAATPAAAEEYWHVSGEATIDVPVGCCPTVTVVNASTSATPATTPAPAIEVRNLNVVINRLA